MTTVETVTDGIAVEVTTDGPPDTHGITLRVQGRGATLTVAEAVRIAGNLVDAALGGVR